MNDQDWFSARKNWPPQGCDYNDSDYYWQYRKFPLYIYTLTI